MDYRHRETQEPAKLRPAVSHGSGWGPSQARDEASRPGGEPAERQRAATRDGARNAHETSGADDAIVHEGPDAAAGTEPGEEGVDPAARARGQPRSAATIQQGATAQRRRTSAGAPQCPRRTAQGMQVEPAEPPDATVGVTPGPLENPAPTTRDAGQAMQAAARRPRRRASARPGQLAPRCRAPPDGTCRGGSPDPG